MEKLKAPEEIAWKLDEYQLEATESPLGNTCVFAVAGSGKTTLLTHRVANLIYHGVPEDEILLLTFTNQAAKEMTERIHKVLNKSQIYITSGTFHSVAHSFLKRFDDNKKQILDQDDALILFKKSYDEVVPDNIDEKFKKYLGYKRLYAMLSGSINHHEDLMYHITQTNNLYYFDKYKSIILGVIDNYKKRKEDGNLRDFDDLIVDVYELLRDNEYARNRLTKRYKYIFVDEYQDVNWLQYNFLKLMNANNNLFVVGDRAQCVLPGTLITTAVGDIPVEKVNENFLVASGCSNSLIDYSNPDKVFRRYYNGPIIEITTQKGYTLKTTDDHKMLVSNYIKASIDNDANIPNLEDYYNAEKEKLNLIKDHNPFEEVPAYLLTQGMIVPIFNGQKLETDKVKEIKVSEYKGYVYDISIPTYRNFIANGIVTHNCIYQFRGSKDEYMDTFETDYPDVRTYFLKKNYRSRPEILKLAENTINFNKFKYNIDLIPYKASSCQPTTFINSYETQYEEAGEVANTISLSFNKEDYEDIVLLLRANFQTKLFEQEFMNHGIPYRVIGALNFYQRAHIKTLTALLTFMQNKKNEVAFSKIVKLFPGIGEKSEEELFKTLSETYDYELGKMLYHHSFRSKQQEKTIDVLYAISEQTKADTMIEIFMEYFYEDYIRNEYDDYEDRLMDVDALIRQSKEFEIDEFLDNINLYNVEENPEEDDEPKVTIMTIHKSKGKEWKYVFIPSVVEDKIPMKTFPSDYFANTSAIKAERNLFYVACTRAKEKLYLTYYEKTQFNNSKNGTKSMNVNVSPFLIEAIENRKADTDD